MTLIWICVSVVIGILVKAYLLPIVMCMVALRNRLFVVFKSEEGKEDCEELMAGIQDEIACYRHNGDSNDSIAVKIFIRLVKGAPSDIAELAPFVPSVVADKAAKWGNTLRHSRVPSAMVAGVATLGLMNYSFFNSQGDQTFGTWLCANSVVVATTFLMWKSTNLLARRILYLWMGAAAVAAIGFLAWLTVQHHLYEAMAFKIFILAIVTMLPAIVVVDTSWRKRVFGGRRWLIAVCWASIVSGSAGITWAIAGDVRPLLETWASMVLFAIMLFVGYGMLALAALALCCLGIKGSAGGLRLVASGIRRLR